jgi:lipoprotein NlpI
VGVPQVAPKKALALKPDLPLVRALLGKILLRKLDNAGALKEFKEYLRREPNWPFAPGARDIVAKLEKPPAPG